MNGLKITPIGPLRLLLFKVLKRRVLQEVTEETEELRALPMHGSFEEGKWVPMIRLEIPPIGTLRLLLFKVLKRRVLQEVTEVTEGASRYPIHGSFKGEKLANDPLGNPSN
jgi:hypothetical protein